MSVPRKLSVLAAAVATSLALGIAPAFAHPVQPPAHGGQTIAAAGGATPAHSLGLACAAEKAPAIGVLPAFSCTIGFGD